MSSRAAAWLCAWAGLVAVSCGKSESGAEPIPRANLPGRAASLMCASLAGCCKDSGFPLDPAACRAVQAAKLEIELNQDAEGRVRYDAQAAGDCLEGALSKIQCGDIDSEDNPACRRIFVGDVALGQPCDNSFECKPVSGRFVVCQSSDGVSPGVCTASNTTRQNGKTGEACRGTCLEGDDCAVEVDYASSPGPGGLPEPQAALVICYRDDGLFCDVDRCAPLHALGDACDAYIACRAGTFCDSSTGLCAAPQVNGGPCDDNRDCQSDRCAVAPANTAEPTLRVCISTTIVSATRCESASSTEPPPDSTESGSGTMDPGAGSGAP